MSNNQITIQTTVNASIQKVWTCWTAPQHIVNWNFATEEWCCPSAENDLQVAGKFCFTMASKDGAVSFDFEGVYQAIVPLQTIVYTLADQRQVTITFKTTASQVVEIVETFDAEQENPAEMQRAGWQAILHNFKKYVETVAPALP